MSYGEIEHEPVLVEEILENLNVRADGIYCDATLGGGGFSQQLIQRLTTGSLIALDRDPGAVAYARRRFAANSRVEVVHANFVELAAVWARGGWPPPHGIVYDLGLSSIQLDDPERGLSFRQPGPLDMRLDPAEAVPTAGDIVNTWPERELETLFREYGERAARRMSRAIVRSRATGPIEDTQALARILKAAGPRKHSPRHPATKVFLALFAAVNSNTDSLKRSLAQALDLIRPGGRIAVVSFQSCEDAVVKNIFRRAARGCTCSLPPDECFCTGQPTIRLLHKGVITPGPEEIKHNPRSRSSKLRVVERI